MAYNFSANQVSGYKHAINLIKYFGHSLLYMYKWKTLPVEDKVIYIFLSHIHNYKSSGDLNLIKLQ